MITGCVQLDGSVFSEGEIPDLEIMSVSIYVISCVPVGGQRFSTRRPMRVSTVYTRV